MSSEKELKPKEIEISEPGHRVPAQVRGIIFTERGIYRPGDRVFFKGTLRKLKDGTNFSDI